jgi:uncharacterized membrane protein
VDGYGTPVSYPRSWPVRVTRWPGRVTLSGKAARMKKTGVNDVLRAPGLLLGVGLGGFVDGILLHQILQWHHMLSGWRSPDTVAGLRMNTAWDGAFHVVTWLFVLGGIGLLYARVSRDHRRAWSSRALCGWVLAGWGIFNLVEGTIDHEILGVHHVRGGPHQIWWDIGFLILGAVLVLAGVLIQRGARQPVPVP